MKKQKAKQPGFRHAPDPYRRHGVVANKKTIYSRKAQSKAEPSDFSGVL
jgi:hypothetical protein